MPILYSISSICFGSLIGFALKDQYSGFFGVVGFFFGFWAIEVMFKQLAKELKK